MYFFRLNRLKNNIFLQKKKLKDLFERRVSFGVTMSGAV